jgi:putative membrane protein
VPALGLGLWLWLVYDIGRGSGWMHVKLAVVVLTVGYHHVCARMLRRFETGHDQRGHVWFWWFNEAPVLMMVAAVVLVVVKPF